MQTHLMGAVSRKKNGAADREGGSCGQPRSCLGGGGGGLLLCDRLPQHSHDRLEGKPLGDVLACSTEGCEEGQGAG